MVKAQELRMGNLINLIGYDFVEDHKFSDGIFELETVTADNFKDINNEPQAYDPIPLTDDLLIKLGFDKRYGYGINYFYKECPIGIMTINISNSPLEFIPEGFKLCSLQPQYDEFGDTCDDRQESIKPDVEIKYLHQLQNLIFCLTGEELTYSL